MFCRAPDGKRIAHVAAGEARPQQADPRVITRIQYKSRTSFSDDLKLHIWIVPAGGGRPRQVTDGPYDEHSIDWPPDGTEIAFSPADALGLPDRTVRYDAIERTGKFRRSGITL